ncbi:hypothetical protein DAKH74_019040 [Maudiozyma humilis]|uniref:Uncharacterized protein n=1 Tax=Maudiozyma humilis TaxID=51915 RepID=A0AAV5RXC9_MAUHU|nr:hypothetical protein DAKH74_019040 [Kazachstania humilis]
MLRNTCRYYSAARPIPKSLLERQARRLANKHGDADVVPVADVQAALSGSFDDIFNMFKPNVLSEEDEKVLKKQYSETLARREQSGEFRSLLVHKLHMDTARESLDLDQLNSQFKQLQAIDRDLIDYALPRIAPVQEDWRTVPLYAKQLQWYIAYGAYGPREHYNDFEKDKSQSHFEVDPLSKFVLALFAAITATAWVKRGEKATL